MKERFIVQENVFDPFFFTDNNLRRSYFCHKIHVLKSQGVEHGRFLALIISKGVRSIFNTQDRPQELRRERVSNPYFSIYHFNTCILPFNVNPDFEPSTSSYAAQIVTERTKNRLTALNSTNWSNQKLKYITSYKSPQKHPPKTELNEMFENFEN